MAEDSMLDIIARMTAQTINKVREVYHETCSETADTPTKPASDDSAETKQEPSFAYGTPFSNIVRFTRDVEVFTRHIDTRTRERFQRGSGSKASKKADNKKDNHD